MDDWMDMRLNYWADFIHIRNSRVYPFINRRPINLNNKINAGALQMASQIQNGDFL
jgi:hypothetical protein